MYQTIEFQYKRLATPVDIKIQNQNTLQPEEVLVYISQYTNKYMGCFTQTNSYLITYDSRLIMS